MTYYCICLKKKKSAQKEKEKVKPLREQRNVFGAKITCSIRRSLDINISNS